MLRYDKHWEALIEHYEEKNCVVEGRRFCSFPSGRRIDIVGSFSAASTLTTESEKSSHFIEAIEKAQVPFVYHHWLECNHSSVEHTIKDHDITLRIPEGAVPVGKTVNIEIGVTMYGPFTYPENRRPISPIVWLCIEDDIKLNKPFQLILPHFLTRLDKEKLSYHQIKFAKANHGNCSAKTKYRFNCCDEKPLLASPGYKSYGVLVSTHCCYYCLSANNSPELAIDAGYCLARVEKVLAHGNEVYFTACFFLSTCIKVVLNCSVSYKFNKSCTIYRP